WRPGEVCCEVDAELGRGAAGRSRIGSETTAGAPPAGLLQRLAGDPSQLRRQGRAGAEADARRAVARGDQPDGGDAQLDGGARSDRRQDRLAARLWRALENHLLDRRTAALGGPPALALRA